MNVVDRVKAFIRKRHKGTGAPTSVAAALSSGNLAELSLDDKERYVRTLLAIAVANGRINEAALARTYQLFAVTELSQGRRLELLREAFFAKTPLHDGGSIFESKKIQLSLAKDAIALGSTTSSAMADAAQKLLDQLNLTASQIDFLHKWIDWENRIMDKIGRGDLQVRNEDLPTELLSRTAVVGVPLTALYFSGSVIGFSAAGITSGLASIGSIGSASLLAGLGLNPMTAGIATLIVAGVTIKKVLDAVLPNTREDRKKLEESLEMMKTIRRRYRDYLDEDSRAFAVGPWWERFTCRSSARREAVGRLQDLAVAAR
jgi:hypothetical protein